VAAALLTGALAALVWEEWGVGGGNNRRRLVETTVSALGVAEEFAGANRRRRLHSRRRRRVSGDEREGFGSSRVGLPRVSSPLKICSFGQNLV
jgi:hypothetical protein